MTTATQLSLNVSLRDDATFDNFFVGKNHFAIQTLRLFSAKKTESFVYCYGHSGAGCSHLLQACCHDASENKKNAFYLPLSHHAEFSPEIFSGLEHYTLVCIDDIDAIIGNTSWEEALFHFYNRARENQIHLLVSAKKSPRQLTCIFPDLKSRLLWGLVLEIQDLSDAEKICALQMRAKNRGFTLSDDVARYLLNHVPRNMRDLFRILEKCDQASLETQHKLTIPFLKMILQKNLPN